jgi:hypothetical protein
MQAKPNTKISSFRIATKKADQKIFELFPSLNFSNPLNSNTEKRTISQRLAENAQPPLALILTSASVVFCMVMTILIWMVPL